MSTSGMNEYFGKMLKKTRVERKMTIQDLSKLSGISCSYISRLEKSIRKSPGFEIIISLAESLDTDVELLTGTNLQQLIKENYSIKGLLLKHSIEYNGKFLTLKEKTALYNIIELALNAEWTVDTILIEIKSIGEQISELKVIS